MQSRRKRNVIECKVALLFPLPSSSPVIRLWISIRDQRGGGGLCESKHRSPHLDWPQPVFRDRINPPPLQLIRHHHPLLLSSAQHVGLGLCYKLAQRGKWRWRTPPPPLVTFGDIGPIFSQVWPVGMCHGTVVVCEIWAVVGGGFMLHSLWNESTQTSSKRLPNKTTSLLPAASFLVLTVYSLQRPNLKQCLSYCILIAPWIMCTAFFYCEK